MSESAKKQSIVGLKVKKYTSKRTKDSEKIEITLEADFDDLGFGEKSVGEFLGGLEHHKSSDTDVGFSVFVK